MDLIGTVGAATVGSNLRILQISMLPGQNSSYWLAIAVLIGWIASVCLHEFGHAIVAYYGGDTTVKDKGYLTLNPLKYTNIGYSLAMPVVFLMLGGIALPGAAVYINTPLLRNRLWQSAVSAAGPLMTGLVAIALALPFQLGWTNYDHWIWYALALLASFQVAGLCFNLLPIPSFDGFGIIEPWLPKPMQALAHRWGRYGYLFLIGMLWFVPEANRTFWSVANTVSNWLGIPENQVTFGYLYFREPSKLIFIGLLLLVLVFRKAFKPNAQAKNLKKTQETEVTLAAYDQAIESGQASDKIWHARGRLLSDLNRYEEALTSYDEALKLAPNNSGHWHDRGTALHNLGRYEEALTHYEKALTLNPQDMYCWMNQGLVLRSLDRNAEAIIAFDKYLKYRQNNPDAWIERGNALYCLEAYKDAAISYEKALKYQPNNPPVWNYRGGALLELNETEKALQCFQEVCRYDPQDVSALMIQAALHKKLGRIQEEQALLLQAQKVCSDESKYLLHEGGVLFYFKDYDGAIALFDKCLEHNILKDTAHYNKACCYALQGKPDLAIASLQAMSTDQAPALLKTAETDSDLQSLHELEPFKKLMHQIKPTE